MKIPDSEDMIIGIAIRLSFSTRNKKGSLKTLFFEKTLPISESTSETTSTTVFPTSLKIQEDYLTRLNKILFFTPDLRCIFEGTISFILDDYDMKNLSSSAYEFRMIGLNFPDYQNMPDKNWFVIDDLKRVREEDIKQYYVLGTECQLYEKMQKPAFPRIYYSDKALNAHSKKAGQGYVFCPYCGKKLQSEDFLFCPYCGKKLSVK